MQKTNNLLHPHPHCPFPPTGSFLLACNFSDGLQNRNHVSNTATPHRPSEKLKNRLNGHLGWYFENLASNGYLGWFSNSFYHSNAKEIVYKQSVSLFIHAC
ncbi:hypothetical protein, partial [Neisseria sp.]|uniref:hypothetical protein n=1 Tax=Neisseria sp. TaxID=192066 RepID=UPI0035A07141